LPIIAVLQLVCDGAFQTIGETLVVWKLANRGTLARKELRDDIWGWWPCHPANCKLPIFIAPPMTTWVGDTRTLKSTALHSSLIVCPKTVHEEAIFTRRKLS